MPSFLLLSIHKESVHNNWHNKYSLSITLNQSETKPTQCSQNFTPKTQHHPKTEYSLTKYLPDKHENTSYQTIVPTYQCKRIAGISYPCEHESLQLKRKML